MPAGGVRSLRRGFGALEACYWGLYGSLTTYFVAFLSARGESAATCGVIVSLFMAGAFAGQTLVPAICDRRQNNRLVFLAGVLVVLGLYFAIYFTASIAATAVLYTLLGFAMPPLASVLDAWVIRSFPDDPAAYGAARSMGSVCYAISALIEGFVIAQIGYGAMLAFAVVFFLCCTVVAFRMPEIPKVELPPRGRLDVRAVPKTVWLMLAALMVMGVANMPTLHLNALLLQSVGGGVSYVGIATCMNALSEFPMMRLSRFLMRWRAEKRLMCAQCVILCATLLMLLAKTPALLIFCYMLTGASYGVILIAHRQIVTENVEKGLQNRVYGLGDIAYVTFGGFAGDLMGGAVTGSLGARAMLCVSSVLHVGGAALSWLLARGSKRK